MSMQQRRQLLELEAAIVNSPDPSATMTHIAQQNEMSPEELAGMLNRNRNDLQESGQLEGMVGEANAAAMQAQGGGGGSMAASLPRRILSLAASILVALVKMASVQISRDPRRSTIIAVLLACTLLAVRNAPRNGIVISSGSFPPLSRGHTTVFESPIAYLERHHVNSWEKGGWTSSLPEPMEVKSKKSSKSKKKSPRTVGGVGMTRSLKLDTFNLEESITVESNRCKDDGFALITTAQTLIVMDKSTVKDGKEDEDEDESLLEL